MGGAGAIPFASVDLYARRFGIVGRDDFARFMALIGAMDRTYLKFAAEQAGDEGKGGKDG